MSTAVVAGRQVQETQMTCYISYDHDELRLHRVREKAANYGKYFAVVRKKKKEDNTNQSATVCVNVSKSEKSAVQGTKRLIYKLPKNTARY